MSDLRTAARQALEAWDGGEVKWFANGYQVMDNLRAALEQPEQEPVARVLQTVGHYHTGRFVAEIETVRRLRDGESLFTHPPRREWRGLTDEQLLYVYNELPNWGMDMDSLSPKLKQFARAIEAALKERNA